MGILLIGNLTISDCYVLIVTLRYQRIKREMLEMVDLTEENDTPRGYRIDLVRHFCIVLAVTYTGRKTK